MEKNPHYFTRPTDNKKNVLTLVLKSEIRSMHTKLTGIMLSYLLASLIFVAATFV